ncbi:MAG: L-2-amino-thiazoline-4-carboxylic acid hydrolase [Immundisolibacterales bacterium]|nr:L-2-amino-thiazoline-4-carboxylic acid hydrolase [Immundisolibacterales bacterium]
MQDLPIIDLRRIEANIIRPIYEEMVNELGEETARRILGRAIRRNAVEQGRSLADGSDGRTGIAQFARLLERWKAGDALRIDVLEQDDERFDFNVVRCRYAEMYREMGLGEIGRLLSCNRDGALCEGYDPRLELTRTQTIMEGATHCNFRYRLRREAPD